eukprot:TRINITY_DN7844_c0_g1_i1.p2 TRINITY_DN7844_c0_g1~~TRINITY_DN7844_c0_g1_i1.p2  ORF type:complete len:143 (+),score=33.29 TRINITY_DN7844_c0_g1_i1:1097-1525(+)
MAFASNDDDDDPSTDITMNVLEVKSLSSEDLEDEMFLGLELPLFDVQSCCAGKNESCLCLQPNEYCKEFIFQNITTSYVCVSCSCDPAQCNQTTSYYSQSTRDEEDGKRGDTSSFFRYSADDCFGPASEELISVRFETQKRH